MSITEYEAAEIEKANASGNTPPATPCSTIT